MEHGNLGRLQVVQLSEQWPSEAQHFTPWLAKKENIALLGEALGIELEVESQEQAVGPFRADILCKDTATDTWVLIENQLQRTDHTHLGQLLTYAAGLDAVTIVWVAGQFSEQHRAALDWLNRATDEDISFFGLEIELWRIGDSPIAPKFNMVAKPNDWSKTVKTTAAGAELTDTRRLQLDYWTKFREHMEASKSPVKCQKPHAQHWATFAIGRSDFHLVARITTRTREAAAYLCINGPEKQAYFHLLKDRHQAEGEQKMGCPLDWREMPEAKESQVVVHLEADPTDRSDWARQHAWLRDVLEKFHSVFGPIVKELDASEFEEEAPEADAFSSDAV